MIISDTGITNIIGIKNTIINTNAIMNIHSHPDEDVELLLIFYLPANLAG